MQAFLLEESKKKSKKFETDPKMSNLLRQPRVCNPLAYIAWQDPLEEPQKMPISPPSQANGRTPKHEVTR